MGCPKVSVWFQPVGVFQFSPPKLAATLAFVAQVPDGSFDGVPPKARPNNIASATLASEIRFIVKFGVLDEVAVDLVAHET